MQTSSILQVCCIVAVLGSVLGAPQMKGTVSDEAIDAALKDKRYLTRQLKCALNEGPCDPIGRRLKTFAPLVLRGACAQCSEQETRQIKRVLSHIQRHYPSYWSKIVNQIASGQ